MRHTRSAAPRKLLASGLCVALVALSVASVAGAQTIGVSVGFMDDMQTRVPTPNVPETHGGFDGAMRTGGRTAVFALTYRQQIQGRLVFQPEAQYARFRSGDVRSADLTIPLLFRYGVVQLDGGPLGVVATAGVAPSFQVSCRWPEPVFQWQPDDPPTRDAPCNSAPPHRGYRSHRADLQLTGGFGLEVRLPYNWIVGSELRIARGLRAVRMDQPAYRAQTFQLLFQIVPPLDGSAPARRR